MAWLWWDNFDKMFCGEWVSEKFEINKNDTTIFFNIELKDTGAEVKFSFNEASCNNPAFYMEYTDNTLYFFHNDRYHRAEYILSLENDDLINCRFSIKNCFGMNGLFEKELKFTRIASLTEEEKEKYRQNNRVRAKDLSRIDILKEYADYGDIKSGVKFEFKFDERENILDIIEKYNLDELVKGKNDVETAIALMNWFCELYKHGNFGLPNDRTPQALLEYAAKHEGRINCRGLSLILCQLIRAYNIKAFHVTCMPYEEPFDDCHVIVCVYCESLGKLIMLDPSNNLYLKNKAGEILSIEEFRNILIDDGELFPNDDASNSYGKLDFDGWYRNYMAKNFIRIERYNVNGYGIDGQHSCVTLIPEKYMQNEAKNFSDEKQKNFITSREDFWRV